MNDLLNRAIRLLAVRDHGETELRRKLAVRSVSHPSASTALSPVSGCAEPLQIEVIEQVITYCYQHDYLDDTRFAYRYIVGRSRKGYGAQRICAELQRKGVPSTLIREVLTGCNIDWCQLAREVAERKFGLPLPTQWQEKGKMQRYLQSRGFHYEEIKAIYADFAD